MRGTGVLLVLLLCLTSRAQAQVSVDMRALDSLGPTPPAARPAAPPKAPVPPRSPVQPVQPTAATANKPPAVGKPPTVGKPGTIDQAAHPAPPPVATKALPVAESPPPALPTGIPTQPPASTTVPAPVASAAPLPPPVRLVFDTGVTELTPEAEATIRDLAKSIPAPAANSINVVAYAAGKPDDPSTARRLSLSRGMAVRSVLLASGIPSAQIYVRALGATAAEGPADQVDLIVTRIGTVTR
jgi:outer membrane protein OmpA-like peptidoglycan-associated protein